MKQFKFNSIRVRLTYWFLLLTLIPLIFVLLITYFQRVNVIETATFDKLEAIRDLKVERLNDWLFERAGDMRAMSLDNELTDLEQLISKTSYNQNDEVVLSRSRELLSSYFQNKQAYKELYVVNSQNGKILVSTRSYQEGEDRSTADYFTKPMKLRELFIKDIYYSQSWSEYSMIYSSPIFSKENGKSKIIGILIARIDLQNSLYKMLLDRVGLGETGETLIVNEDVKALNELRWHENAPLNLTITSNPAVYASKGQSGILATIDYREEAVLAAYTYIAETAWGFVCKQDLHELNAPIRQMILNFTLIFLISSMVIVLISFRISKSISKPIVEMNQIAHKFGMGNFAIRNTNTSDDELGSLALEFNNMADLTESRLQTQKGVSDISETMIAITSIQEFGLKLLKQLMATTDATMSAIYILNEVSEEYEHFASIGANKNLLTPFSAKYPEGEIGNAISKGKIYYLREIPENTIFKYKTISGEALPKEIITIPILVEDIVVAVISLANIHSFSTESYHILEQSTAGINVSYSNLMSSQRTSILADQLTITNQNLESQAEELQEQSEELQNQSIELKRTSEELQEQNVVLNAQRKQVETANKMKSEFLSNMSHELRTPLNSIMALSRVLITQSHQKLNKEENSYLEIIERNGKRLLSLINDILDLSKIEAGKMEITPELISNPQLLLLIKDNLDTLAKKKIVEIKLDIPDNIPKVETEETKLYQVLTNIIGNAVKFTQDGQVEISATYNTTDIVIGVKDTGIGISTEMLPHIFDEFRQADGTSARLYEGTGLGLAIANKLTQILGGTIDVKSEIGKGTEFTINIPIKWHEEMNAIESIKYDSIKPIVNGRSVLVIEDDLATNKEISEFLENEGFPTLSASSGKEGLELAERHQLYAITLDIVMPEMDGWETLQKLKANPKTRNIPVIIISTSVDKETGYALGAMGYINKPVNKNLLISEIHLIDKKPRTIMIADDNDIDRKEISTVIRSYQIDTIEARGGYECIQLLKTHRPDILILDLLMPDLDSFSVVEKIRTNPNTKDLPIIIVTAKDLTKEDKLLLSGNVQMVISKGENLKEDLYKQIKHILYKLGISGINPLKKNKEPHLLLIEDNEEAIIQVKKVLEKEKYKVDIATGGQMALDFINHTIPDGIILDLMMPDIDGFAVLEKIRSSNTTKSIPVLILTAKDLTKKDLARLSANNIQQLIQKGDIDIEGLLLKVKQMLMPLTISKPNKSIKKLSNVLIIEDNPDNMLTLKALLSSQYEIFEAFDGQDGLKKAQSQNPDLILLDMALPKLSGEKIIENLKNDVKTRDIPIIAVTAQAMKGDREKFIKLGCDGYVSKPIDNKLMLAEIRKLFKN